ncbi:PREDICTED: auxin response factor [Prunus dulcis]|uniref:PREDICTED: auxin response factor n=1 Tax=Prunus dulcis TaxID=3755 RepID=A0A5E4G8L1_PRUDU|nr:PREDICTED: auxin response factor [Prunus dulcis]
MAWFKVEESLGGLSYSELLPIDLDYNEGTGLVHGKLRLTENLFIFPSLTSSLKRPLHSVFLAALQQQSAANGDLIAYTKTVQAKLNQKNPGVFSEGISLPNQNPPQSSMDQSAAINVNTSHAILPGKLNNLTKFGSQTPVGNSSDKTKLDTDFSAD